MELTQSCPFEAQEDFPQGEKKPTHDFLSACSNNNSSTVQPDSMPSSQGEYLKTHDFLQPLEHVGTRPACAKEAGIDTTAKSPHMLPGGIGTYTISHIPYLYHNQQTPKSEVSQMFTVSQASSNERNAREENSISNCSSYAASGFTLWDKSLEKKEHSRRAATMGQWQGMEQRSSSEQTSGLKIQSQSFMDMIASAKGSSQEDDMDDDDEEFVMKKENNTSTSQRVDLRVKVDGKGQRNDQKPNTPRSKHSATEQRRRSKINDRFQMLRKVIPNSDQKRDKASFLLEVIEYIHILQEKVNKHDLVPYKGNLMNLRNHQQTLEPVLADAQAVDMDQQCLNRAMETSPFPVLGQRKSVFTPAISQLCPVSSDAAMESEKLRGEAEEAEEAELSVHKGTISISSVYSQGLLKTLTETLQTSGVDLSKAGISVQIKLSKKPQKDEEVHRRVRLRSQSGDDNHNDNNKNINKHTRKQKKLKKDNSVKNL